MTKETCASCGESKKLCRSIIISGVQQPRRCKDCIISAVEINDAFWINQLEECGDVKSLAELDRQINSNVKHEPTRAAKQKGMR